jgi:hypothetical protein
VTAATTSSRIHTGCVVRIALLIVCSDLELKSIIGEGIYKMIILPVVLYGCETWSLILREEHILRVFENRVLRKIFGPKRDEVILHELPHDRFLPYSFQFIIHQ